MAYAYAAFSELEGPRLGLRPLVEEDLVPLAEALLSPTTWVVVTRGVDTPGKLGEYFRGLLAQDARGESLTLVARIRETGEVVATSRFHGAGPGFSKIEIGFTWVADRWTRTFVNSEMKYLMLRHAFEAMGAKRVEFAVDPRNQKSNAAMTRLGAKREGMLRKWRFLGPSDPGDRNIYSVIDDEWPAVRAGLEARIDGARGPTR